MRNGLLGSVATLLAGTGLALAQAPTSAPRPYVATPSAFPPAGQLGTPIPASPSSSPAFTTPVYTPRPLTALPTTLPAADPPRNPANAVGSNSTAGDKPSALKHFTTVYSNNIDYRDVAERIKALKS